MASLSVKYWIFWIDVFSFILRFSIFFMFASFSFHLPRVFDLFQPHLVCHLFKPSALLGTFSYFLLGHLFITHLKILMRFCSWSFCCFSLCAPTLLSVALFLFTAFRLLWLLFTFVLCCWVLSLGPHSTSEMLQCWTVSQRLSLRTEVFFTSLTLVLCIH